jgi:hypothetical protein
MIITINYKTIDLERVRSFPRSDEKILLSGAHLVASKMDIVLDNSDSGVFDDRVPGSLFYGVEWYNRPVEITDGEETIWKGRIKNIRVAEKNNEIIVETYNLIKDLAEAPCVISDSGVTAAEIIYDLLIDTGFEMSDLLLSTFQRSISIQEGAGAYVTIDYERSHKKNVLPVVNELCRMTQCHLYSVDNRVGLYQWQTWAGENGKRVDRKTILTETYSHYYDYDNIVNDVSVDYSHAGNVYTYTDTDAISLLKYGTKVFNVPNSDVEKDTSKYRILFESEDAAEWAGDLAIQRFKNPRRIAEFELHDSESQIKINDQIDYNDEYYTREPLRVIERKHDRNKRRLTYKTEFMNVPVTYQRALIPPDAPVISAEYINSTDIEITITGDASGWLIYFTAAKGEWEVESSGKGVSPVDVKVLVNNKFTLTRMSGTVYIKVVAYDENWNRSADSNIVEVN